MSDGLSVDGAPLVSVVVPTRDRPDELRRAVEAVVGQRYAGPIECLVVFDQSEPKLPDVPLAAGRTLRAVVNDRTPGLAGGRNTGILAATGELVAFCDDDDVWMPDKLTLQVPILRSTPSAVIASCGMRIRYGTRSVVRLPDDRPVSFRDLLHSRRAEIHPSSVLVRREDLLGRVGLVDEELPGSYAEDYEWMLRATRHGTIVAVPRPLLDVYWHRSSYFAERWETIARSLRHLLERYPEFRQDRRGLARIRGQIAFALAAAGDRKAGRRWAMRTIRTDWRERRSYLALAVSLGVLPPGTVLRAAHVFGKGL